MDLEKIINSDTDLKIIEFFHNNPHCVDTIEGIATWTNQPPEKTKKSLEKLVKHNILVEHKASSTNGYAYTHDEKISGKIQELLKKRASL